MKQYNNYLATTKGDNGKLDGHIMELLLSYGDKGNRIIDHNYVMNKGQSDYRRGHISLKYLPNPTYIFGMNNTLIGGQYASGMFNPHSYSGQNYERNLQKMIKYIKEHKVNTRLWRDVISRINWFYQRLIL